jgi:uncharacterized membrane protein YdbT with pleckstrin-like domain
MSYINKSLGNGETVILRARFHWLYDFAVWGSVLVPGAILLWFLARVRGAPEPFALDDWNTWVLFLLGAGFVVCFVNAMVMVLNKWATEVGVTSHRFVEKYGIFTLRSNEIAVPNIEGVRVNQDFFGRVFNYGKVQIEGTGDDSVLTPTIADPIGFVRAIQTAKEHMLQRLKAREPIPLDDDPAVAP